MTTTRRTFLLASLPAVALGAAGCTSSRPATPTSPGATAASAPGASPLVPYDVTPLRNPAGRYLGVALPGPLGSWSAHTGSAPNLVAHYVDFSAGIDTAGLSAIHQAGGLPLLQWQPDQPTLAQIGRGAVDDYLRAYGHALAGANIPVAISFGHEMNGNWYPWGMNTSGNTATDFVAAYRRVHDVVSATGARAIWVWNPNVTYPAPTVPLAPLYPGDGYVDWVGVVGYFTHHGRQDFDTLFGPTFSEVRRFTQRPFVITETAGEPGLKEQAVTGLFLGLVARRDLLGFAWFDYDKRADWRLEVDPQALITYRQRAAQVPHQRVP